MAIPEWLEKIDESLFVAINHDWSSSWLDPIMKTLRYPQTWIPLYAFILFYIIKKEKKDSWKLILTSIVTVAITDSVSASIMKPYFARLRPCAEAHLHNVMRSVIDCGGLYSFPSSHAANHFGMAACWFFSFYTITGKKWYWLWIWAFLVCYAQIYVGKHYPLDILCGALLGILVGSFLAWVFKKWAHPNKAA